jgi:poly(3-hydroxybutyrate) depolymerase
MFIGRRQTGAETGSRSRQAGAPRGAPHGRGFGRREDADMNHFQYALYEMAHAALVPYRAVSDATRLALKNPLNPWAHTPFGRNLAAGAELFERITRRYGKPIFGLDFTVVEGREVEVVERVVWERPFCKLVHFERQFAAAAPNQPKLVIVAPMSGHYATLLRGTVEAFLPTHEVYITDWADARDVPLAAGPFDLDDYVDYMQAIFSQLGRCHVLAVCQPAVPVIAATALMEAMGHPDAPASMTLMGGPIDTREGMTEVNKVAETRGVDWFRRNCIHMLPFPYPGMGRQVYPGFLQLSGFMAMNIDRHMEAHVEMFNHLVEGDGDSAEKHRDFYDEYLAVMDLTAEFYLQTIETVFVRHALPKGEMVHRGAKVDLAAIRRCGLMTVEGERDDIAGVGQCSAAHGLCVNIPQQRQVKHLELSVGHYGVFNGSRFRKNIAPAIRDFIQRIDALDGVGAPARKRGARS